MSSDFLTKCRTCLSDSNFFHQLFDYVDEKYKILEMLEGIVPQIDIKCNTQFSSLICQPCVDKLLTGYKFQQLCIENNNRLHEQLGISSFETDPKLEKVLDPLIAKTDLKMKQEIEDVVCYEQEIDPNVLEVAIWSDSDSFENKSLLAGNKKYSRKHDKLVIKDRKVDMNTKDDKIKTPETENNAEGNEPKVCVKEELEITGDIFEEPMDVFEENGELFSNEGGYSDDESDKGLLVKRVKFTNDIEFKDTDIPKIKKTNGSNRKRGNFSCEVCGKVFDRLYGLKRHSFIHSANVPNDDFDTDMGEIEKPRNYSGNYACEVCGKIFVRPCRLNRHIAVHSPSRPHECEICKYRFATLTTLKGHLFQHENGTLENWKTYSRPDGFKCPDCPRRFEKHASLSSHRRIHTFNYTNYPCIVCQSYFTTLKSLTQHITDKHPELEKHKCDQCEKSFVLHSLLVEHLNRHKGNNNLVCLICEEEFVSTNDLTEHMRTHSGYANTLTDHLPKPGDKGLHLCPQCGKTFSKEYYLRQHLQRHSEIKQYQCPECPSRFACNAYLRKHALTHTNIKRHACDICGSRFKTANEVRKHKRWHSGEKPFKCDQCSMTFTISDVLKRHMRTHTGEKPYKCKYCERAYADRADLNKHLRTHVGENTYMCDQCSMAFKYYAELKRHQMEHYKLAQKHAQQMSDEAKQHKINYSLNIQSSPNDTQQQLSMTGPQNQQTMKAD